MMHGYREEAGDITLRMPMKLFIVFCSVIIISLIPIYGCSNKPSPPPAQVAKKQAAGTAVSPTAAPGPEVVVEEAPQQEGYIYQQKDRRDPFVPLIVPTKKVQKGEGIKAGTLEGYDIGEFTLAAIAKKGSKYIALMTTPDNRSFTVREGAAIGLNRGKVRKIANDRMIIVEYSMNYRGESKPREIIIEFRKGEVE
ncbi:MAG: pilus assembly protein PilP [Deltaproteobacteria bacterium]|nr:pilus assembly protein PilP [Deltaproteobacteria bacterium]